MEKTKITSPTGNEWYTISPAFFCNYCGEAMAPDTKTFSTVDGPVCEECYVGEYEEVEVTA